MITEALKDYKQKLNNEKIGKASDVFRTLLKIYTESYKSFKINS